jgi:hypothetical protein
MARDRGATDQRGTEMPNSQQDSQPQKLDRAKAFTALARLGADRAVVAFSGGNDEGGPDAITLFSGEEELRTLPTWWQSGDAEKELVPLSDALSTPVFEAYGTFAGDFAVDGQVIWDVTEKTVRLIRDERSDYQHSEDYV